MKKIKIYLILTIAFAAICFACRKKNCDSVIAMSKTNESKDTITLFDGDYATDTIALTNIVLYGSFYSDQRQKK